MKKLTLTVMMLFVTVSAGLAQKGSLGDFKQTIDLQATEYGQMWAAQGRAVIGRKNGVEYFGVRMLADVKDGTIYHVLVNTSEGSFPAGTITMFLGAGQLLVQSSRDALSDVFPVTDIQSVVVRDLEDVLLEGSF